MAEASGVQGSCLVYQPGPTAARDSAPATPHTGDADGVGVGGNVGGNVGKALVMSGTRTTHTGRLQHERRREVGGGGRSRTGDGGSAVVSEQCETEIRGRDSSIYFCFRHLPGHAITTICRCFSPEDLLYSPKRCSETGVRRQKCIRITHDDRGSHRYAATACRSSSASGRRSRRFGPAGAFLPAGPLSVNRRSQVTPARHRRAVSDRAQGRAT
jgi:hypothetical protein